MPEHPIKITAESATGENRATILLTSFSEPIEFLLVKSCRQASRCTSTPIHNDPIRTCMVWARIAPDRPVGTAAEWLTNPERTAAADPNRLTHHHLPEK